VLFLAPGGRTVFLGNLDKVEGYFAKLGFTPRYNERMERAHCLCSTL